LQQALDEKRKCQHDLHVLDVKDKESEHQEMRLSEEIEMGHVLQSQIQVKSIAVEKALVEVEQSLADVIAACAEFEQDVAVRKHAVEKFEIAIHEARLSAKKHEADRHQTGIQSVQLESMIESLEKELLERHRLTIEEAREICEALDKTVEQTEKQIKVLRQQLENAGDINMTSIEECNKLKGRYQFLNQQIDDLNVSRQGLIAIITQLDGESRKIFKDTFQQISINFKKNFSILFNGGEADLQFTETADVLETGIEIIAKPPGKQMRSISLLSGGEKCLTAMALLFAIFEVKPAPFCILDEIDAPLDDTNVERFVSIVKEYVNRCQFIIITHNKRTMAIADVIFGVSMEEKGVSKLLSIDFSKSDAPEAALSHQ
jgi:chromosome segregation protein